MPAQELGCGDGDPLHELRRRSLEVDGVDSSADVLERSDARDRFEKLATTAGPAVTAITERAAGQPR